MTLPRRRAAPLAAPSRGRGYVSRLRQLRHARYAAPLIFMAFRAAVEARRQPMAGTYAAEATFFAIQRSRRSKDATPAQQRRYGAGARAARSPYSYAQCRVCWQFNVTSRKTRPADKSMAKQARYFAAAPRDALRGGDARYIGVTQSS